MQMKAAYLEAMREQAPQMFNRLRKTGALDQFVQKKGLEAQKLYEDLTSGADKLPNGEVKDPQIRRSAEEQVLATLIDFPDETQNAA
jgi:hypothetical protein